MQPPELPTAQEERQIAQMIEVDIDISTERKHAHEIMIADFYDQDEE